MIRIYLTWVLNTMILANENKILLESEKLNKESIYIFEGFFLFYFILFLYKLYYNDLLYVSLSLSCPIFRTNLPRPLPVSNILVQLQLLPLYFHCNIYVSTAMNKASTISISLNETQLALLWFTASILRALDPIFSNLIGTFLGVEYWIWGSAAFGFLIIRLVFSWFFFLDPVWCGTLRG